MLVCSAEIIAAQFVSIIGCLAIHKVIISRHISSSGMLVRKAYKS